MEGHRAGPAASEQRWQWVLAVAVETSSQRQRWNLDQCKARQPPQHNNSEAAKPARVGTRHWAGGLADHRGPSHPGRVKPQLPVETKTGSPGRRFSAPSPTTAWKWPR